MKNRILHQILAVVILTWLAHTSVFGQGYEFMTKWGTIGSGNGQFSSLLEVAIDSAGNVYVADTTSATPTINNRIQKFTSNGDYLTQWGTQGSGDGQFDRPLGIAVDSSGNVYVADMCNHRIQKFTSSGVFVAKWGAYGTGDGQFLYPQGIAVDSLGNVYVADQYNNRIQKFNSNGDYLTQWGTQGSGDGQFDIPIGVAVDSLGNVYVTDTNHRIQVFRPVGINTSARYVDDDNTIGPWNGTQDHPFQYIQDGINAAMNGDTVLVADGIYKGSSNKNLDFNGKAITVKSQNSAATTIIDCENNGRGFYFHSGETLSSVLDGFTITNGNNAEGGGINCKSSSPTIKNNIINRNFNHDYDGHGGGICCNNSSPLIQNNEISENFAKLGGGIYCDVNYNQDGSPMIPLM